MKFEIDTSLDENMSSLIWLLVIFFIGAFLTLLAWMGPEPQEEEINQEYYACIRERVDYCTHEMKQGYFYCFHEVAEPWCDLGKELQKGSE